MAVTTTSSLSKFLPAATASGASSTTASSTLSAGTATSLLTFTTPYVYSPQCTDIWDLTSAYMNDDTTYVEVLVSNPSDPRISSCQPSGWADVVSTLRWTFSPAVCPSGWTAYALRSDVSGTSTLSTYSSAVCCSSGFTKGLPNVGFSLANFDSICYRTVSGVAIPARSSQGIMGAVTTRVFTSGLQVHQAWVVEWAEEDASTLTPQPPQLTNNAYITSWVPGASVASGAYDNPEDESSTQYDPLKRFLEIGLPLILVALFVGVGFCCCSFARRRRAKSETGEVHIGRGQVGKFHG